MGNEEKTEEKLSTSDRLIARFSSIKSICDTGIASITRTEEDDIDLFELTEKIQEEIEEIRDIIFE